jgi:pyridoxal biosynthesis lyase PdxS
MRDESDKTIRVSHTYRMSHIKKLREISEKTFIPVSALIRKALIKFFKEYEKDEQKD